MSTLAGWTHVGSNGSSPMRPDATPARVSRSESTTVAKYGLGAPREREHARTQIRPCLDHVVRAVDALARKAPQHLDRSCASRLPHRDVRVGVADDDALSRRAAEARHRMFREIRRGLRARHRVAAEIHVDLARDAQPAQDALAVRGALAGDGRLKQSGPVERVESLTGAFEQLRRRDDLPVIDLAVLGPIADRV